MSSPLIYLSKICPVERLAVILRTIEFMESINYLDYEHDLEKLIVSGEDSTAIVNGCDTVLLDHLETIMITMGIWPSPEHMFKLREAIELLETVERIADPGYADTRPVVEIEDYDLVDILAHVVSTESTVTFKTVVENIISVTHETVNRLTENELDVQEDVDVDVPNRTRAFIEQFELKDVDLAMINFIVKHKSLPHQLTYTLDYLRPITDTYKDKDKLIKEIALLLISSEYPTSELPLYIPEIVEDLLEGVNPAVVNGVRTMLEEFQSE